MVAKFKEIKLKLREAATDDYRKFVKRLLRDVRNAVNGKERRLVVMAGSDPIKVAGLVADVVGKYVRRYRELEGSKSIRVLNIFHDEFPDARVRAKIVKQVLSSLSDVEFTQDVYEASSKFLGTTYEVLILDLTNDLKPNDVGRLSGVVIGGGLLIFMTPNVGIWNEIDTIFRSNLAVPNHPRPRHIFIKYFVRKLFEHEAIYVFDVDNGRILKDGFRKTKKVARRKLSFPENRLFPDEVYSKALTQDQVNVIKLVEDNLVPNPGRKRVALVIVADRGRGKSCAIGISLAGFIKEMLRYKNRVRIAVTALEPLSVQSLMRLAAETLDVVGLHYSKIVKKGNVIELKGERFSIEYWEPYTVLKLGVDMVVVDEAAGIPVPLLHSIWQKFRRTVYATTIHGYEGAGRGFQIRFLKRLKEDKKTKLVFYEMLEPIRYSKEDPVEGFLFDVLKLNAEPDTLDEKDIEEIKKKAFEYVTYDPEYLFSSEGEKELASLFGIFVLAHYRNEPDDLGRIADAPHHSIRAVRLRKNGKIVAAAQLAEEGNIPEDIIDELIAGGKIPGNIIPDRLLKHFRVRDFGQGAGWRVVRIATHLEVQGMGIGSYLLGEIVKEAVNRGYSWVGAGFGVTRELLNFWVKNGFIPVHFSPDRNRISGEYTSIVIRPITERWKNLVKLAAGEFSIKLAESLHSVYWDLEPDIVYHLFKTALGNVTYANNFKLTDIQRRRLDAYLKGIMTYESVADAVNIAIKKALLSGKFKELEEKEAVVGIARALQGRLWDAIFDELHISKGRAISALRRLVQKITGGAKQELLNQ